MLSRREDQPDGAGTDPRQILRMRRFAKACLFPGGYLAALAVLYFLGLVDRKVLLHTIAVLAGGAAFFFLLFLTRVNLKSSDRNLTAEMTLSMIAAMLWILYEAPISQIFFGPFVLLVMMASAFRTQRRTLFATTLLAVAGCALVTLLHFCQKGNQALLTLEMLHAGVLICTLPGFIWMGSRVRRLYRNLYRAGMQIESIEEHARRDELTGCYNRRYMMAALKNEKMQADVSDASMCLAVIDLDHFKRINDDVGHLAGDKVLRAFVNVAQQGVRKEDIFGRYGGEEFLLILPGVHLLDALNTVERIRSLTEEKLWVLTKLDRRVTVSIGITQYIAGESVIDLFSRADAAMYLAKAGGRNQVVVEERPRGMQ